MRFNFLGGWLTSENDGEVEARLDILGNSGGYLLFETYLKSLLYFFKYKTAKVQSFFFVPSQLNLMAEYISIYKGVGFQVT